IRMNTFRSIFDGLNVKEIEALRNAARSRGLQRRYHEKSTIERIARTEPLPLSFAQERLWFLSQLDGASGAYHVPLGLRLQGVLDSGALRRALDRIVARHEALRTTFGQQEGRPVQRIGAAETGFALQEHDLRGCADAAGALARLSAQEAGEAFDLERG